MSGCSGMEDDGVRECRGNALRDIKGRRARSE